MPAACRPDSRSPRRARRPRGGPRDRRAGRPRPAGRRSVRSTHAATRSPRRVCVALPARGPRAGSGTVASSPPSRSVSLRPSPVRIPTRSRSGPGIRIPLPPAGNGITAELSSSRLCRCRHSQPRRSAGAASSWRAASATSCADRAATAAASRARYAWNCASRFSAIACRALCSARQAKPTETMVPTSRAVKTPSTPPTRPVCRRANLRRWSSADGGRARIGSSARNRRRSSASASAVR